MLLLSLERLAIPDAASLMRTAHGTAEVVLDSHISAACGNQMPLAEALGPIWE